MVAAVIQRRGVQTRIHQQILENRKKRKRGNYLCLSMNLQKKASKKREESLNRALESIQESLKNDPTCELLSLLKEDSERQQQRDERFFTLISLGP